MMQRDVMKTSLLAKGVVLAAVSLLWGCSEGGLYDGTSTGAVLTPQSGTVAQGKVVNAKVCADLNFNNVCDPSEPSTITSASAAFAGEFVIRDIPQGVDYQYVTEGGYDILAKRNAAPLKAPAGSRNVTTVTTLVSLLPEADQPEMIKILDQLSGGQGYDIDISSAAMPPEFLALAKVVEEVSSTLEGSGMTDPKDQEAVLAVIAKQMLQTPPVQLSPTQPAAPLSEIIKNAATTVATSASQGEYTDFSVNSADVSTFSTAMETLATDVTTAVENNAGTDGTVQETEAIQNTINTTTTVTLPVGSISLAVAEIAVNNSGGVEQAVLTNTANGFLEVASSSFSEVVISLSANNTLDPVAGKTYQDAAFTLSVSDQGSNRSLALSVTGITLSVSATGDVTFWDSTPVLAITGVNATGSVAVEKSNLALGQMITFSGSNGTTPAMVSISIDELQAYLEGLDGTITEEGSYIISVDGISAPLQDSVVQLTLF
ncbi:MAG: hypothetical protein C0621_04170 [Desulfuromonas sp.]|nr:MAG: hypothetical protein C0621_04170 [Desulfuromonas sp.]